LNGHEFPVTRSLWGALQRLRSEVLAVLVWADAICINQQDTTERGVQVRKMTSIYRDAHNVAVWLGPEAQGSGDAVALMHDALLAREDRSAMLAIIASPEREQQFRALVKLFERDYWQRLWCVQEVANAKKVMVYCGPRSTLWDDYVNVQRALRKYEAQ
jgi:Heterokaryon incompatibility protein (HET)